jgi:hypothetical protein
MRAATISATLPVMVTVSSPDRNREGDEQTAGGSDGDGRGEDHGDSEATHECP